MSRRKPGLEECLRKVGELRRSEFGDAEQEELDSLLESKHGPAVAAAAEPRVPDPVGRPH